MDDNNHTALIIAIEREDSKMVEHLLSYYKKNTKTLDINHKDSEQMTGEQLNQWSARQVGRPEPMV